MQVLHAVSTPFVVRPFMADHNARNYRYIIYRYTITIYNHICPLLNVGLLKDRERNNHYGIFNNHIYPC